MDDSFCTSYKHVAMLFYIFLGGGGEGGGWGSRKTCYLTKWGGGGYQIKRYRLLHREVGGGGGVSLLTSL